MSDVSNDYPETIRPQKQVSASIMNKVVSALSLLREDPTLPRTKLQIEKLTGLSHASVARAFVQDSVLGETSTWQLNTLFGELVAQVTKADSATDLRKVEREKNAELRELEATVDRYAQALFAYWVNTQYKIITTNVIPLGANRSQPRTNSQD